MAHIRRINEDIDFLVNGAQQSALNLKSSKTQLAAIDRYYQRVRYSAQSICNVLTKQIQEPHACGSGQHGVNLCLEMRDAAPSPRGVAASRLRRDSDQLCTYSTLSFRILLSLTETQKAVPTWRELEVEAVEQVDQEASARPTTPCKSSNVAHEGTRVNTSQVQGGRISRSANGKSKVVRREVQWAEVLPHYKRPVTPTGPVREFLGKLSRSLFLRIFVIGTDC